MYVLYMSIYIYIYKTCEKYMNIYIYMKSMHPQITYSMVLCIFKQFLH